MSSALAALVIFSMEISICSFVWVAISEYLIRQFSLGTAGDTMGFTKMPSASKVLVETSFEIIEEDHKLHICN